MTDETANDDDLVLTPPEGMEDEAPDVEDDSDEEFSLELEGEIQEEEPPLVKKLRDEIRERDKKLAAIRGIEAQAVELGPEPEFDDFWEAGDPAAAYKAALLEWTERKRKADEAAAEQARRQQLKEAEDQQRIINYRAKAAALPVKDFDVAEQAVVSRLPEITQAALLAYTDDPAKMVYALAKHPQMLEKIASEPDPIRQIIMAREMEGKLKVTTRKKPPAPEAETIQRGGAPVAPSSDKEEARLYKEAEKSGDWTAWTKYRREKRRAA